MQTLSRPKNTGRRIESWKLPLSLKLRKGQEWILDNIERFFHDHDPCVVELPTGYGKTLAICLAYAALASQHKVNRLLIVVPNNEQLNSYLHTIENDFRKIGYPITGAIQANSDRAFVYHKRNKAEVFVTSIQALCKAQKTTDYSYFLDLMSGGNWMLAADEFHHYSSENSWGAALAKLTPTFTLAVSATPYRTDGKDTFLGKLPDYRISLDEAQDEGAIRRYQLRVQDYFVDLTDFTSTEDVPYRFTLTELGEHIAGGKRVFNNQYSALEVSRKVRYHSKYLCKIIGSSLDELRARNLLYPNQHRMIVYALGCAHAKHLSDSINDTAKEPIADWIGSGKDASRTEKENERILQEFKDGKIKVLVQYAKAAEGFDCPQASILLFLNNIAPSVLADQMRGRALRRNYAIPAVDDLALIFISRDHQCLKFFAEDARDISVESSEDCPELGEKAVRQTSPRLYDIPDFFSLETTFKDEETYFPMPDGSKISLEDAQNAILKFSGDVPIDYESMKAHMMAMFNVEPVYVSTEQKLEEVRSKVNDAVGILAGSVIKLREGGSVPKSLFGDLCKTIHWRWTRETGLKHSDMDFEQFLEKLKWVQNLNGELKKNLKITKELSWMML